MASSSSKRCLSMVDGVDKSDRTTMQEMYFVCLNLPSSYKIGTLKLPSPFVEHYGQNLEERVSLQLPCGTIWHAYYDKLNECLKGLEEFMKHYHVKPYHLVLFKYCCGTQLGVEICNTYAVEISYPEKLNKFVDDPESGSNLCTLTDGFFKGTDVELEKLCCSFNYNAYSSICGVYDLVIKQRHLKKKPFYEVFNSDARVKLGLDASVKWIELGFRNMMWKIQLKWDDNKICFNKQWHKFAEESKLAEGDICVLQLTGHSWRFEVAVFEKKNVNKMNRLGYAQGKSYRKWLKIMNDTTIMTGELEIPRLFAEDFRSILGDTVTLLFPDGKEYNADFCKHSNLLFGLKPVVEKYSLDEHFVMFFNYVGRSTFYVSIIDPYGMEIFTSMKDKLTLKSVMRKFDSEVVILSETTVSSSSDTSTFYGMIVEQAPEEESYEGTGGIIENTFNFTQVLKVSHVDKKEHGLYFPRSMLPVYRSWKNGEVVTLHLGRRSWNVALHRKKNMCRFGRGWSYFTSKNKLKEGQKLHFVYVNGKTMEVTIVV